MAGLKEIRRRIGSVKSTMQITRAMKLVSAAKLKRAQELAINGRTFSARLSRLVQSIISDLRGKDFHHPAFEGRDKVLNRLIIVMSSDRGLCGGYNTNLIKTIQAEQSDPDITKQFIILGRKAIAAGKRLGWNIVKEFDSLPENPVQWPVHDIRKELIDDFVAEKVDEVVLYYTRYISGTNQKVESELIIPLSGLDNNEAGSEGIENPQPRIFAQIEYSPSSRQILREIIPALISMKLRQAAFEAKASEHSARMTAMDSATHNASELIDKLKLFYNRARQSSITKELLDIVGGAEAIK